MLILHAPNVHQGGGRNLLLALLDTLNAPARVHLDQRFLSGTPPETPIAEGIDVHGFAPSLKERFIAERQLHSSSGPSDIILCFGNLPPLFRADAARTYVFIQNRYLLDRDGIKDLPLRLRLRIEIERVWLRRALRTSEVIVQTQTMADLVLRHLNRSARVLPFRSVARAATPSQPPVPEEGQEPLDMLYVASGEPHKNHATLFDAWGLLADANQTPVLGVTLSRAASPALAAQADTLERRGARIDFLGPQPAAEMPMLYARARALVFPSHFESFGLPLLEAAEVGIPIIASERDYVRDVVRPRESFDPSSARSIARAVQRFLKQEADLEPVSDARTFLVNLLGEA